jgi:hypothetical protein
MRNPCRYSTRKRHGVKGYSQEQEAYLIGGMLLALKIRNPDPEEEKKKIRKGCG